MLSLQEASSGVASVGIILATIILYIQNHKQSKATKDVKTSITENNGGSSVKDRLDCMDQRLTRIESVLMNNYRKNKN